jgi:hypothetical protein
LLWIYARIGKDDRQVAGSVVVNVDIAMRAELYLLDIELHFDSF